MNSFSQSKSKEISKISRLHFHNRTLTELLPLKREKILSKFTKEELDSCWESLCIGIIQNYQRGKATIVKGFGTFTFKGQDLNLEGTTNEYERDKKERLPIFLVSKEFNENLKTGEYNKKSGVRYFTSKENKDIPISSVNFTEIAFSLSMKKEKVYEIIKHLICYINDSIINNKFKNKDMPGLGVLILKQNILAVKFDENFENDIKNKNSKLNNLKKNLSLDMDFDNAKDSYVGTCPNVFRASECLKSTNSLITQCKQDAKNYLQKNYNILIANSNSNSNANSSININQSFNNKLNYKNTLSFDRKKNNYYRNSFFYLKDYPFKFLNDAKKTTLSLSRNKILKTDLTTPRRGYGQKNPLLNLDFNTLKTLSYFKGSMVKDSKDLDIHKTGSISKEEAITMLMKNIPDISHDLAQQILEHYFISDQIDYMRFIALLIKGSKNSFLKKKNYFNFKKYFVSNKNDSFNNTYNNFYNNFNNSIIKKNINLKSVIQKQKNKKIAIIKRAEKEMEKKNEKEIKKLNEEEEEEIFMADQQKMLERNKKELSFISSLIPEIKNKYAIFLDQNISTGELIRILQRYDLIYTKEKLEDILNFIGIRDFEKFSLRDVINKIKSCVLVNTTIDISDLGNILNQIKDFIYVNGGEKYLFNNELNRKNTIDVNTFIKLLKNKTSLSTDELKNAFYFIVKMDKDMSIEDFNEFFLPKNKKLLSYDEPYFIEMMKKIIVKMTEKLMSCTEYFDHLLSYNISTLDKVISRLNWIKYLQLEKFNFNAEELDHFFNWIDTKKDNVIDIDEFTNKYLYTINPLTIIKNIVHNNKLDIEDLAHRMQMSTDEIKKLDYFSFLKHVQKLDYTLPETFIRKIFNELKKKDNITGKEYVESKKFLDKINYVQPPENYESFTQKYVNTVKSRTTYEYLKKQFEKYDQDSLGTMTKLEYVTAMSHIFPEFNDDDHMRFVRIMEVLDKNNKVIYPEILNIIYYCNINKMNDHFTKICEFLLEKLNGECENNVERLMYLIETGQVKKTISLNRHKPLTAKQIENFLTKSNISIEKKVIMKLDLDSDGLFSYEDLYSVLLRYRDTLYFKYYNNSNYTNILLFPKDVLSKDKLYAICEKILAYMKMVNITPFGFFKKFDKDNNGLISNIDFNQGIKELLNINAAVADPFFSYLDYYNIGMIDFETFMSRLNYLEKSKISENDRKEENEVIEKIKTFILKSDHLSDNEIFQIMDKDSDGLIKSNDLIEFIKNNLDMREKELSKSKIERIMMTLSLTKNLQIGFNDISELIKLIRENKLNLNLNEVFKLTANQNLSQKKKNVDWINDIIIRFGMYVSEKYGNIEQFFKDSVEPGSTKFKFSDFLRFHESHYDLFNNGFHLSKDELLSIFTSLDSHKKNYLTLQDLQNKLQYFNFYKKMHFDIKDFFQSNFKNGIDAFKYFFKGKNINENKRYYIYVKEFYDSFESFFPNKYENNTILKYMNKYFNITLPLNDDKLPNKKDTIDFKEFNYIYFDKSEDNDIFIKNFNSDTKLLDTRTLLFNDEKINNSEKNFYFSQLFKNNSKDKSLITPFDNDPFNKLIRIINSSKYDINSFFEEAIKENQNIPYVNKAKLRNIIKKLNIGLTNLEIDIIINKCSNECSTDNGENINLKRFQNIINNENDYSVINEGIKNIRKKISEIKTLIYKFYCTPLLCFQIVDNNQEGKIDFQKYRNLIVDLYTRNEQEVPNFALIKNTFDTIDLRKDGIIDYKEWSKTFSMLNGKLDLAFEKLTNRSTDFKIKKFNKGIKCLRQWENSDDITQKYLLIYKNRKQIKNKLVDSNFIINKSGKQYTNADTLISVIQKLLPNCKLSQIQWKMITNIGKKDSIDNLICLSDFFKYLEIATKKNNFKSYNSTNEFKKIYYGSFDLPKFKTNSSSKNLNKDTLKSCKDF